MRVQYGLHFGRVDIQPKADDQFFGSADDKEISFLKASKVTGVKPSLMIHSRNRLLRRAIVSLHNIGSTYPELTDFPIRHRIMISSDKPNFYSRKDLPNRSVRSVLANDCLGDIG